MPTPTLEQIIADLTDPGAYQARPERVETLQTHASVLFFAGERVYKVKKPVDLGFLNFSTLERRRRFCEEEVRLNQPLAPGVYLRVAPIGRGSDGRLRIDPEGEALEHAVEMVRLPSDRMLDRLLERPDIEEEEIRAVVDALADAMRAFHEQAPTGEGVDEHARPAAVRTRVERNLEESERFVGLTPDRGEAEDPLFDSFLSRRIRTFARSFLEEREALLKARVEAGRIREGHGDAHPGNVCAPADRGADQPSVIVYDRIEFERSFRCLDVAADLAVTGVGLDVAGRADLSSRLIDRYAAEAGDDDLRALQPLYRLHYASVRAKVDALLSREGEAEEDARGAARDRARRWFLLAAGYAQPSSIVLTCGLPGTGKSVAASEIARSLRTEPVRSDVVRKSLAGLDPFAHPTREQRETLYDPAHTDRTYARLMEEAIEHLERGEHAVLDATYLTPDRRRPLMELAIERRAPLAIILTTARPETVKRRMEQRRTERGEPSDADWSVYRSLRERFVAPDELEGAPLAIVDEGCDRLRGAERAMQTLAEAAESGVRPPAAPRASEIR